MTHRDSCPAGPLGPLFGECNCPTAPTNPPPGFAAVETYDVNEDDSVTIYARDFNGDPIVKTYPAGEVITVLRGAR